MDDARLHFRPDAITAAEWRQIVQSATDTAIITTDPDGSVTSWNEGARRILGWTESEMLGQSLGRLFDDPDQLSRELRDAAQFGRGGGHEGWRLRSNGARVWAAGEMTPIRGERDEITGFVKVLRDRTAARAAEQAVAEERRALEVLNRAGSALAAETDLHRLVQIVTDAGVELTGAEFGAFFYNVLDERGESYRLYTLSGAPAEAFAKFPQPRNTDVFGPTFRGERIVRSDDITQDPDGVITYFNPACIDFTGRRPEVGQDRWCVTWRLYTNAGEYLPHDQCPMAVTINTQRPIRGVGAVAERPDGTRVVFRPYPTPIFDAAGQFAGAVNLLEDVTDEVRAADLLAPGASLPTAGQHGQRHPGLRDAEPDGRRVRAQGRGAARGHASRDLLSRGPILARISLSRAGMAA